MKFDCKHDVNKNSREFLPAGLVDCNIFMCECGQLLNVNLSDPMDFHVLDGMDIIDLFHKIRDNEYWSNIPNE